MNGDGANPKADPVRVPTRGSILDADPDTIAYVGQVSREITYQSIMTALRVGGEDMMRAARAFLKAHPMHAEIEKARELDHTPCPSRCRKCSRCIHSLDYWARGGKPFPGVGK